MDKAVDSSGENKQDQGCKNKRKSVHPSVAVASAPTSLIEFPRYELPSELPQSLNGTNPSEVVSDLYRVESEMRMNELVDWNDPIANQLEELLLSNLQAVFHAAIKQIVELGYGEEVAHMSISRRALYIEEGDPVSNIVQDTVNILKGKDVAGSDVVFENFQHLLYYTMLEMISVLREVRPSLTAGEAMWLLLMCDLNISLACSAEDRPSGVVQNGESSSGSSVPQSKPEVQISESDIIIEPTVPKELPHSHQNKSEAPKFGSFQNTPNSQSLLVSEGGKLHKGNASLLVTTEKSTGTSVGPAKESKPGSSSKRHNRKEIVALRQKFLHMEKAYRACGKGGFKSGKLTSVSSLVVEKRIKQPSEIPNQQMKCGSSNSTSTKGVHSADAACCVSTNSSSTSNGRGNTGTLPTKDATSASTVVNSTTVSDTTSKPKSEPSSTDNQKILDFCAGIPYDESLGKYVPRDEKDELTLMLIARVQELQFGMQSWNNWTKQKVMQVTERLGKVQSELKALRKEKQEADLYKKDQKLLEENAVKRISEMENAMENTRKQIEHATSAAVELEAENASLKKELDDAKLWVLKSMTSHRQALEREQIVLKQLQSWESQNGLLRDELDGEKHSLSNLLQVLHKEKNLLANIEGRLEQERAVKEKLLAQAASIRKERQQLEAHIKSEEDTIRKRAANDMQKYVDDIARLEKELIELKIKSESEQIAALRRGVDGKNDKFSRTSKNTLTVKENKKSNASQTMVSNRDKMSTGSLRREQECVMCLSDEMSVVFLPCAHQVVCQDCNELHEKQGMKDCPSCRTPIQRRIHARFAGHSRA
ncbi:putative E3 ubiquitin-protein ligase RF4 [Arachis stenosperma]|uniref:putative E3 ubiquitin-protein ligase RF4 n=1 Tax=Arachis stenosperma TaxID=217475 RepID=UPI0025ABD95E|nr:putative E3 ubiquitin-protein ligase RF4 [Arachis stenosperma]